MKKALSFILAILMLICAIPNLGIGVVAAEENTLSTSTGGKFTDLNSAINGTPDGGTITVIGTYTMPSGFSWTAHGKTVTITGGTFDTSAVSTLHIKDGVTFTNTNLKWTGTVYANGNPLTVDSSVTVTGTLTALYGGGNGSTVTGTSLTVLAGNYKAIYGGGNGGKVNGDTYVYVGGSTNSECATNDSDHSQTHTVYGGGNKDTITGNTHTVFGENAKASYVFGGSKASGATIGGTAYLDVTGGYIFSVYGAGSGADCVKNTLTTITGGSFHQIFGGANGATVTGDVTLRVFGGTISRRIYGGCYNNYESFSWKSNYKVTGTIKLVMGSGATVSYSASDSDRCVYARTRHKDKIDGSAQIYYTDSSAKTEGHDPNDYTKKYGISLPTSSILGIDKADASYTLSHSASGNVITETGGPSTATATLKLRENAALNYTGAAIEPMFVEYSADWLGEPLSAVIYSDNVAPGQATSTASYTRKDLTVTANFNITIGEKEHLLAIADGTLSGPLTLSENISLPDCDAALLCKIADAVDSKKISFGDCKLTDLSVNIANGAELSAIREYAIGDFTLTGNIDLGGVTLTSPLFTLDSSTLSGNGYAIYNYSVTDCGLIDVAGDVSVSSIKLGAEASPVNTISSEAPAAPLVGELNVGCSLSVSDIVVYVNGSDAKGVGGIAGSSSGELTVTDAAYFDGNGKTLMVGADGTSVVSGTPIVCGIQTGQTETVTVDGKELEVFSIRFIASIKNTLDYKSLGISVSIDGGEAVNINTHYVYTSLLETSSGGEQRTVTATELGGTYVYAIIISGIPTDGISGDGAISFTATPYATDNGGNEYIGEAVAADYLNGEYVK